MHLHTEKAQHEVAKVARVSQKLDCEILYHLKKANRVANALSRRTTPLLVTVEMLPKSQQKDLMEAEIELVTGRLAN